MNVTGHQMTLVVEIAPTAVTEGLGQQTCTDCGHVRTAVKIPTTRYSKFDVQNAMDEAVKKYRSIGLQVATIKNGKLSFVQSYGWAEKNVRPMTDDTKLRIASPTKVIVSMCAMSMVDAGLLDLDAPLSAYWGEEVMNPYHPENPPTMRHLLTHVSSLKEWDAAGKTGLENLRNMLKKNAWTTGMPGDPAVYAYNNFAFNVVGTTLEIAANQTLESYFQRKFLSPMGIRASFLSGKLQANEMASMYWAGGYLGRSAKELASAPVPETIGDAASNFCGGLVISAKDYARLMAILINDGTYNGTRYLSASAVATMETPQFTANNGSGSYEQCLVLRKKYNALGRSTIYYHTGSAHGLYSQMTYDPVTGDGVVVITSGGTSSAKVEDMNALCADITRDIFAAMNKG
jgi:CubicO group peptidase (beta-lactamase class C family)